MSQKPAWSSIILQVKYTSQHTHNFSKLFQQIYLVKMSLGGLSVDTFSPSAAFKLIFITQLCHCMCCSGLTLASNRPGKISFFFSTCRDIRRERQLKTIHPATNPMYPGHKSPCQNSICTLTGNKNNTYISRSVRTGKLNSVPQCTN